MLTQSHCIVASAIEAIMASTWKKVAERNVERMMPTNVRLMNVYTFQSIAELNSELLQASDGVNQIGDRTCMDRDNLLGSFIKVEKGSKCVTQNTDMLTNNSIVSANVTGKFKINKAVSKSSNHTSKIASHRNKQENNPFKILETTYDDELEQSTTKNRNDEISKNIQILRDRMAITEQINKKEAQELKIRETAVQEKEQMLRKKKKQIDKFTYDYDGDFFGSKIPNPENTLGAAAKIRLELQKEGGKNQKKIQKSKPLLTTIVNQKLEQRYKRLATQQLEAQKNQDMFKESLAARFANSFSHDDNLSEGISIKETTSNFSRMKPLQRIGQKLTLSEFKKEMSNKKFQQFRTKPIKTIQTHHKVLKNKLTSYKSQQNFIQNKNSELASQLYNPSQKNKRYKTMFRSEQSSILNQSELSRKTQNSHMNFNSVKGRIKVSNPSLYKSVVHGQDSVL